MSNASLPDSLQGPTLILGEGPQDEAFFTNLITQHRLTGFDTGCVGGKDVFGEVLGGLRLDRDFRNISCILLVSDNDDDPASAFDGICRQIRDAGGYGIPPQPLTPATASDHPSVIVMMLPWVDQRGCLETLCYPAAVAASTDISQCVETYASCVRADSWGITRRSKMLLACMLATACKSDPNTGLRYAWNRPENLIPLDNPCFDPVVTFLHNL